MVLEDNVEERTRVSDVPGKRVEWIMIENVYLSKAGWR